MKKLRVATIGAGYFSQFHYDAWSRIPEIELVALCDMDAGKAKDVAARWSIPEVFSDAAAMLDATKPDLVDIITPPPSHLPLIELAAARGINAICQKAFCQSLDEAHRAADIAEQGGILLVVHENFRFQPWYGEIKRVLEEGTLGRVYQALFRLRPGDGQGPDAYLNRQPYFQKMERFLIHETAIHLIDVFRFLFGDVDRVFADLRRLNPVIAGEDAGIIILSHRTGVKAIFDGNRLVDHPARNKRLTLGELIVEGQNGVIRLDGDGTVMFRQFGASDWSPLPYIRNDAGTGGDSVFRLQRHVVDHLIAGTPVANRARDYLVNLAIEDAAYRSAHEGSVQIC